MWNDEYYARSRSHSFNGNTPAMNDYMRAPSPSYATPQPNYEAFQPSASPAPVSPGGFVIPQHGYDPPLPPTDWNERGRSRERGIDLSRDLLSAHTHHRHRAHSHEPVIVQGQPHEHRHHRHKHRHGHHHRSSSRGRTPNITVHHSGQVYTVPSRPGHQQATNAPVYGNATTAVPFPHVRTSHSAQHLSHAHGASAPHPNPAVQMQMPVPRLPPKDMVYYGPSIGNKRHYFKYSQCCGKKKALCIGINYTGQPNQLNGCINDAKKMRSFLIKRYGFQPGDIVLLTDEGRTQRERPTKRNIIDAMKWLVKGAQTDDSLVFHFSGHGGQTKDLDGDEVDGYDEVIYPIDWKRAGHIVDDDMHAIMVRLLPAGCRLTAIFDCCHSGSALDLPYMYGTNGKVKREPNLSRAAGDDTFGDRPFIEGQISMEELRRDFEGMRGLGDARRRRKYAQRIKTSPADAMSWSGCKDSQTSADTYQNNEATGAMSYAFMSTLKAKPDQTYQELLVNIRKILKNRFSQKPQLSASHPIDTSLKFVL